MIWQFWVHINPRCTYYIPGIGLALCGKHLRTLSRPRSQISRSGTLCCHARLLLTFLLLNSQLVFRCKRYTRPHSVKERGREDITTNTRKYITAGAALLWPTRTTVLILFIYFASIMIPFHDICCISVGGVICFRYISSARHATKCFQIVPWQKNVEKRDWKRGQITAVECTLRRAIVNGTIFQMRRTQLRFDLL